MFPLVRLGRVLRFSWVAVVPLTLVASASGEIPKVSGEWIAGRLQGLRIPFIANSGQIDPTVAYYASTFAGTVYVTRDGRIVYSLPERASVAAVRFSRKIERKGWALAEKPVGGRAYPKGKDPASTRVSYFLGSEPARWRSGLTTFDAVSLGEVWPGISLELRARGKNVEKLFRVEPSADPSQIRMSVAGARSLRVNEAGALVVGTGLGEIKFTPPAASQERQGVGNPVKVAYELHGRQYGFRLVDYDAALPVLIDPLLQATYLGGSGTDAALALAIHPTSGEVYIAGGTNSTNFPGTAGGPQVSVNGDDDAFVARLNPSLTTLIQATYLGGNSFDSAVALAIHPSSGQLYVAGLTLSTDFPGTAGGAQPARGGGTNAFISRLNTALTTLNQSTYLGGGGPDLTHSLAIHPTSGDVYVAGETGSSNFPGTAGGAQATFGGDEDAFVGRLNASLTTLNQATYLGGSAFDGAFALAIHPTSGEVYIAGSTLSTNLPGTPGGAQSANLGGFGDAFVARLSASLTTLNQATYLGGSGFEEVDALVIHPTSGEVYVAGGTDSTDFPGITGGAVTVTGGNFDAFVARLNPALSKLDQSTFLGGDRRDQALALAIVPTSGDVYAAGFTLSPNFPGTAGGAQAASGGDGDAFVARLNAALTTLNQATYLGGSLRDIGFALAIHPTTSEIYVAGQTESTNFPGTAGGAQAANGGGFLDGFVARLSADLGGPPTPTPTATAVPTSTRTPTPATPVSVPMLSAEMLVLLCLGLVTLALFFIKKSA
jgi:hypothetical protein